MINEKAYCERCDEDVDYSLNEVIGSTTIRSKLVKYVYNRAICKKCGHSVFPVSIGRKNSIAMYDAYKKSEGLLTSDEIITIRKSLGLTQTEFADYLKLGAKTIARYENGAIQDKSIDELIRKSVGGWRYLKYYDSKIVRAFKISSREVPMFVELDLVQDSIYQNTQTKEKAHNKRKEGKGEWKKAQLVPSCI